MSNEEIGNFVVTEVQVEGMLGPKGEQGEKGEPFTYADFTEQQLAPFKELKDQAQTAATTATNAASTATQASLTTQRLTDEVLNMKTDIQKVAENRVAITAVSLIKDQVVTVSEASDDIKAVSKDLANIDSVVEDIDSVKTVATSIADVNTVSAADTQVKTVAGLESQIRLLGNNQEAVEALYKTLNMTVAATSLPAGSEASVTQEATSTGFKVTFGIPKGDTGEFNTSSAYNFSQPIQFSGGSAANDSYSLFSKYKIQIGDTSTSVYSGVITWRNCGISAGGVNGAGFYVNSNGTAKFVHKTGYNSSSDDAVLSFNSNGLYFATAPGGNVGAKLGDRVETISAQVKGATTPSAWKQHFTSGYISQGGYVAIADVGAKITFPQKFSHTPSVFVSYIDPENPAPSWIKSIDSTGFTPGTSSTTATGLVWCAIGFV